jgi:HEAT repeat protein
MSRLICFAILLLPGSILGCNRAPSEPAPARAERGTTAPAATSPSACDRRAITIVISTPEEVPTSGDVVRVCAEPRPTLVEIARDTDGSALARLRAVGLLGELGGDAATRTLAELALATADLASVRRASLVALGRATAVGDAERERVGASALSDRDAQVRRAAATLLRGSSTTAARRALDTALARETEPFVRKAIENSQAQQ